jgi:hypothetical protein
MPHISHLSEPNWINLILGQLLSGLQNTGRLVGRSPIVGKTRSSVVGSVRVVICPLPHRLLHSFDGQCTQSHQESLHWHGMLLGSRDGVSLNTLFIDILAIC